MKLTDAQIEKIKDLVDEANNYGNTPDWQQISDRVGAEVNENRYKKLVGTYRSSEEDKQKLQFAIEKAKGEATEARKTLDKFKDLSDTPHCRGLQKHWQEV